MSRLTTDMRDEDSRPYFLWDEPLTIRQLREILRSGSEQERLAYMAKILREARYEDVWEFLSVDDLVRHWEQLLASVAAAPFGNFCCASGGN